MKPVNVAADLKGLWAAIPTPFTKEGKMTLDPLKKNVESYAAIPMDGVYTTDSDGEFYALEIDDFKALVKGFAKAMEPTSMAAAIGVTWSHTQGIIDRIKICIDHGIPAVHVAFPYWMPMTLGDMFHFWDDLAKAAPAARWIHYNTGRSHLVLKGRDYARIVKDHPEQMISTKQNVVDIVTIADCIQATPEVAHFVIDYMVVPGMMLGAKGTCSFWVNSLPKWMRRFVDLCMEGKWAEAMEMQKKLLTWEIRHVRPANEAGHLLAPVAKARWSLSDFLDDTWMTAAPYYPLPSNLLEPMREAFKQFWGKEYAEEGFKKR